MLPLYRRGKIIEDYMCTARTVYNPMYNFYFFDLTYSQFCNILNINKYDFLEDLAAKLQ